MITIDDGDKAVASAFEAIIKKASIEGVPGYTDSVMTTDQYSPTSIPATLPRDVNRDTGIAVAVTLRSLPLRVLVCSNSTLPAPTPGGIIFVQDGAGGGPVLAFSDGTSWLRCDTRETVG